ncbi:MAG TPA: dTDP-4-dehydrorhamnose 3,5-epimerase [Stellaceae bacterium]|jgi:dTDP-4-dehydrorhamnose 3,5-epimerase|nr:dTDP-4-dehydrorhamnose 3,5-epimerase [Stellaceae bacterium]
MPDEAPRAANLEILATVLPAVKILTPRRIGDSRGFFSEVWNVRDFAAAGIVGAFVQDNHIRNPLSGTLRGLHYQLPPLAQGKLLRVTRGAILDVAVDIRRGSPTFGRHAKAVLSADNWRQFWVPQGFAHGYCTLEDDTEVQYKVTDFYSPTHERGIAWDDPEVAVDWPFAADAVVMSERDRMLPRLADQPDLFDHRA